MNRIRISTYMIDEKKTNNTATFSIIQSIKKSPELISQCVMLILNLKLSG